MKVTYKEILEASGGMSKLLDLKLKPAKAIELARLCRQLNEELVLFKEAQGRIHGGTTDADLKRQFDELLAVEVEIPGERIVLTFDEIGEIDGGTVMVTEPFVCYKEAET